MKVESTVNVIPNYENISILVAEDDVASFIYLKKLLQKTKANILYASNGSQAVEMINSSNDIQLVLMDIKMPVMSGIEALKELKKKDFQIPVIAQTAYAYSDEIIKIKEVGFSDYISKPINAKNLYLLMSKYLKSVS